MDGRRKDQHLLFGVQVLGVESGCFVVWSAKQSNVCAFGTRQSFWLAWPDQHYLDHESTRLRGISVKRARRAIRWMPATPRTLSGYGGI